MTEEANDRFPCSDEHIPRMNYPKYIVDNINKLNESLYGPVCKRCEFYDTWCRCDKKE